MLYEKLRVQHLTVQGTNFAKHFEGCLQHDCLHCITEEGIVLCIKMQVIHFCTADALWRN
jgi:hypothetical protein